MQPLAKRKVSASEYLMAERAADSKHELVNGEVVAMAGASPAHNLLSVNLCRRLAELVASKPCVVLSSDQRIHAPATSLFSYPDVSVVCDRPQLHPDDDHTVTNPRIIVEVLSDSTEGYDRGAKFAHYQSIPSLAEYVLVSSKDKRVEHYRRQANTQQWLLTVYTGDADEVAFPALDGVVHMRDVYEKWETLTAT